MFLLATTESTGTTQEPGEMTTEGEPVSCFMTGCLHAIFI